MCERSYETFDWCSSGINLESNWHLFVQKRVGLNREASAARGEACAAMSNGNARRRSRARLTPAKPGCACGERCVKEGDGSRDVVEHNARRRYGKVARARCVRARAHRAGALASREEIVAGRSAPPTPAARRRVRTRRAEQEGLRGFPRSGRGGSPAIGRRHRNRIANGHFAESRAASSKNPAKGGGRIGNERAATARTLRRRAASRRASGTTRRAPLGAPRATRRAFAALRATSH
ncbi:putative aMP-binding domain protein [Burkholderia pseudomallei NCTC 13178]|nr:putative aMP-binding domain protein [Burkholderia pseudomallei NCTC 13178]